MSSSDLKITVSKVALANPIGLSAGHPLVNADNHKKLLNFLMTRLQVAEPARNARAARYVAADKQLFGWLVLDSEDAKRKTKQDEKGSPVAIEQHLPLSIIQLNDRLSYFMGIFGPANGMFAHTGNPEEHSAGQTLLKVMNHQAQHAGYYPHLMRALLDINKYHVGGLLVEWDTEPGFEITIEGGKRQQTPTILWEGNRTEALDMYNVLWTPGICASEVDHKAEYCALVSLVSYHELQRKGASGEWFNVRQALDVFDKRESVTPPATSNKTRFYKHPPAELKLGQDALSSNNGWVDVLSYNLGEDSTKTAYGTYERVRMWCWLNPTEFGLAKSTKDAPRDRLELWKIEILNGLWIVSAEHVTNIHGRIPVAIGLGSFDSLGEWQKSSGEILRPLQDFVSFLLNTHIKGVRKNIWGTTIYDPEVVDLKQIPEGDVAARIPAKPTGADKDLSKAIYESKSNVDTKQTMTDLQGMLQIVNQLFPTQALPSQIASIDRAVDRQVAAVMHGANRPLQAQARFLDETFFRRWRSLLYMNILEMQTSELMAQIPGVGDNEVNVDELLKVPLDYIIGQGLKALDRQLVAQELQRIILAILQSQDATAEFDVVALINELSNYLDIEIDLTRFRRQGNNANVQQSVGLEGRGDTDVSSVDSPEDVPRPVASAG